MASFYGNGWRGSKWKTYELYDCCDIPDVPCCYVVIYRGVAIYVGQSTVPSVRLKCHGVITGIATNVYVPWLKEWVSSKDALVKCRFQHQLGDYAMREIRLIKWLKPEFNSTGLGKPRKRRLATIG